MTLTSRIFVRLVMTSSCTPSAKNSFSFSALRFANGSTAIDFSPWASPAAEGDAPPRSFGQRTIPAITSARAPSAAALMA